MRYYTYDLETMINFFSYAGKFEESDQIYKFEISDRRNDRDALIAHLKYLQQQDIYMVGFNTIGFDYPILHELMTNTHTFDQKKAYNIAQQIIGSQRTGGGFNTIRPNERHIKQIDLFKINHFDNANKKTRLKDLQFAMRSESLEDLPFDPHTPLTHSQMDTMLQYNDHDILETEKFLKKNKHLIEMRKELLDNRVLFGDVLNYSDVKIGSEYLISRIGRDKCFVTGSQPRQSIRHSVVLKDVILPKIYFRDESYNAVLEWFKTQTIYMSSEEKPRLDVKLAGINFVFGLGGVHASVENKIYESNDTHVIKDVDVSGMYVAVAIANGFAPEHLGQPFSDAYKQLQRDRSQYPKGSTMNAVLKLAGNGVYGNSNNKWSPYYDAKYTFTVTVNGQLQLLQLVEVLASIPKLEIIQANTDGITAYVPREHEALFNMWCKEWEKETHLKLEHMPYKKMFIADVNNYMAVKEDDSTKLKGKYWWPKSEKEYEGAWNKDFSNMVVQKCAEQVLLHNYRPEDIIRLVVDKFDFMSRYKTTTGSKVYIGDKEVSKTCRYYVSLKGEPMIKKSTPKGDIGDYKRKNGITDKEYETIKSQIPKDKWDERIHTKNKSKYEQIETSIESGRLVKECNDANKFNIGDLDYDYYIQEIRKLLI